VLRGDSGHLLVGLFSDLDETLSVYFTKPLQVSQLASQFQERAHDLLNLVLVQSRDDIGHASIAILQKVDASASLGVLFVIKGIDIFKVTVEGKGKLCVEGMS
jgi:hypothetical protein